MTPLGKRVRVDPNGLVGLARPDSAYQATASRASGIVVIAPRNAAYPVRIDVIVSLAPVSLFDFCPEVDWKRVYVQRKHASNIKKTLR